MVSFFQISAIIEGEQEFLVLTSPRLENCKTIPPKGIPLTKFKVKCDYDESRKKNFEIQVKSGETGKISRTSLLIQSLPNY